MKDFFGINSADSFYNKRRHVNCVFYTMMHLRLMKNDKNEISRILKIAKSNGDCEDKADAMCANVLTELESSYLYYLKERYGLPNLDYARILAAEGLTQGVVKSPATYTGDENWRMIIQMFYGTMLSGPSYQDYVKNVVENFFYPFFSGMTGVMLRPSTFRILSNNINTCLNQGKRLFSDLPYIETYSIQNM